MKNIPPKYFLSGIWVALVTLLFGMFGIAHLHLKSAGTVIILLMAVTQMLLVLTFFMRLRTGATLVRIFAAAGFFWLCILITLALSDYLTRQWH
jgi:cytochrome c oxidase subunit 4